MAYQKKEKKKSLPTLLGGLTSFGSVANLIKNLKSDSEFYELEVEIGRASCRERV